MAREGGRAPSFVKHERARLAHILCLAEVDSGVVAPLGGMTRKPQYARQSRAAAWVVLLTPFLNSFDMLIFRQSALMGEQSCFLCLRVHRNFFLCIFAMAFSNGSSMMLACSLVAAADAARG